MIKSDKNTIITEIVICFILLILAIKCSAQVQERIIFNTKDNDKGHYYIVIEKDSMTLMEIVEYTDRHYINRMQEEFTYYITSTHCGQMYFDVYTDTGTWTFFYCKNSIEVCEGYFKPFNGKTSHYERLLNNH